MLHLNLICFGKLKTPGARSFGDYYSKLSSKYLKLKEIELKPESKPLTRNEIQHSEKQILKKALNDSPVYYLLDETGKSLDTEQWKDLFKNHQDSGHSKVHFILGSAHGVDSEIKSKAKKVISLGPQTLSHELARLVFFEQVYRSMSYLNSHPYHNAQ